MAGLHMVKCFAEAGFPPGLLNCITGKGSEIGDFLTMHPAVNCIRCTEPGLALSPSLGGNFQGLKASFFMKKSPNKSHFKGDLRAFKGVLKGVIRKF